MKTDALAPAGPPPQPAAATASKANDIFVLTKARLNALVVATSAGGFYMAAPSPVNIGQLLAAAAGTALVACGSAAFNQVDERDLDRLMRRTQQRPVASGRMRVTEARIIAAGLSVLGLMLLILAANLTAAIIALATLLIYVYIYTPMKRVSSLATVVGAVPGALPPLIGWTAAGGSLAEAGPWALFAIMFVWQLPHFLAIGWLCREDYAKARMPMLPVVDRTGQLTSLQSLLWAATLVPISQLPLFSGMTTRVYAAGALVLGLGMVAVAVMFARQRTDANARGLFYGSITYLPLLWLLMAVCKK